MELNPNKEEILEFPTKKEKQNHQRNEIFAAEINANDHNLNGIIEENVDHSRFNEIKEYLEGELC
ncbi:MAG: hypothetical protein ACI4IK_02795 [Eubacterium sp.]